MPRREPTDPDPDSVLCVHCDQPFRAGGARPGDRVVCPLCDHEVEVGQPMLAKRKVRRRDTRMIDLGPAPARTPAQDPEEDGEDAEPRDAPFGEIHPAWLIGILAALILLAFGVAFGAAFEYVDWFDRPRE